MSIASRFDQNSGMSKEGETGVNSYHSSSMRLPHESESQRSGITSLLQKSKMSKQQQKNSSVRKEKMSVQTSSWLVEVRDQQTLKVIRERLSQIPYPIQMNQGHGSLFSESEINAPLHLLFRPSYTN